MSPTEATKSPAPGEGLNLEIYQQDGDYIKDIEVNDLRNRYTLTKGSTQKMVITHSSLIHTDTPSLSCFHTHHCTDGFVLQNI